MHNSKTIKGNDWECEKRFSSTKMSIYIYIYFQKKIQKKTLYLLFKPKICLDKGLRRKCTCKININ